MACVLLGSPSPLKHQLTELVSLLLLLLEVTRWRVVLSAFSSGFAFLGETVD